MDSMLSRRHAAERLGVSQRTVARLIEAGQIRALRVGAQVRIQSSELDEFINERAKAGLS